MNENLLMLLLVVGYLVLQIWVLPRLGVST